MQYGGYFTVCNCYNMNCRSVDRDHLVEVLVAIGRLDDAEKPKKLDKYDIFLISSLQLRSVLRFEIGEKFK